MEKKLYIYPVVEILPYSTPSIMKLSGSEEDTPPDPGLPAPKRRTQVF